jgi:hypothetical protein
MKPVKRVVAVTGSFVLFSLLGIAWSEPVAPLSLADAHRVRGGQVLGCFFPVVQYCPAVPPPNNCRDIPCNQQKDGCLTATKTKKKVSQKTGDSFWAVGQNWIGFYSHATTNDLQECRREWECPPDCDFKQGSTGWWCNAQQGLGDPKGYWRDDYFDFNCPFDDLPSNQP